MLRKFVRLTGIVLLVLAPLIALLGIATQVVLVFFGVAVSAAVSVGASASLLFATSAAASPASASVFPLSHILYAPEFYLLIVPAPPPAIVMPRVLQPALLIAASCLVLGCLCRLVHR